VVESRFRNGRKLCTNRGEKGVYALSSSCNAARAGTSDSQKRGSKLSLEWYEPDHQMEN
jgi:hypothetical protein